MVVRPWLLGYVCRRSMSGKGRGQSNCPPLPAAKDRNGSNADEITHDRQPSPGGGPAKPTGTAKLSGR
jgi:hypothetical protein